MIRQGIAEMLNQSNNSSQILSLIDEGYLEPKDVKSLVHTMSSDQFLYDLAIRSKNEREAAYILKFIADKDMLTKIVDTNGEDLKSLSDANRANIVESARKLGEALTNPPEIYQADNLKDENKFIVSISL